MKKHNSYVYDFELEPMEWQEILEGGDVVTIFDPNAQFAPTCFWMDRDSRRWVNRKNPELGVIYGEVALFSIEDAVAWFAECEKDDSNSIIASWDFGDYDLAVYDYERNHRGASVKRKADYGSFYGFQEWDDTYGHHRLYDIGSGCFIELLSADDNDVDWMIFDEFHSDVLAEGHSDSVDGAFMDALNNFPSHLLRSVAKKRAMKKRAGDWDYPMTDDEWDEIDRVVDDAYLDIEQWIDDGEVAMGHADVVYDAMAQYGYYLNERQQLLACLDIIKNLMRDGYLVCSGDYFAEWWTRN